jgi:D-3-phosphoglycerate dehydrogenase
MQNKSSIVQAKIPVLITERFSSEVLFQLSVHPLFNIIHRPINTSNDASKKTGQEDTAFDTSKFKALIIRSGTKITPDFLNRFPSLEFIVTATAGFDHINLQATAERSITVSHCPSAHTHSASELTWSLVLACCRKLLRANEAIRKGDWDRNKILGSELYEKTYGVIGLGRIGARVAKIAAAFGMKVMAHDPYQKDEIFESLEIKRSSLEELLRSSDVVSLHVPLTRETKHLMSDEFLDSMNENSILVNTSRGEVVHEHALIRALDEGKIGAAGLDVFEYEPLARDSKLFQFKNLVLTPHIGATTHEAFFRASHESMQKLILYFNSESNQQIQDILPPKAAWYS